MLLEHEAENLETGEDVAEACEALDFEDEAMSAASGSSVGIATKADLTERPHHGLTSGDMMSSTPKGSPSKASVATTVTADIHDHVVKPLQSDLPDLLPRPEPPRGRHYSEDQEAGWVVKNIISKHMFVNLSFYSGRNSAHMKFRVVEEIWPKKSVRRGIS